MPNVHAAGGARPCSEKHLSFGGGPESDPKIPGAATALLGVRTPTASGRIAGNWWPLAVTARATAAGVGTEAIILVSQRQDLPPTAHIGEVRFALAIARFLAQQEGTASAACCFEVAHIAMSMTPWAQHGIPHFASGAAVLRGPITHTTSLALTGNDENTNEAASISLRIWAMSFKLGC